MKKLLITLLVILVGLATIAPSYPWPGHIPPPVLWLPLVMR